MMNCRATNGRLFHAPDDEPQLPVSVAQKISGILGLDDAVQLHPNFVPAPSQRGAANPANLTGSGPNGGLAPSDIKNAYNLNGFQGTGAGQTIALVEFDGYKENDITSYENNLPYWVLPTVSLPKKVLLGSATGIPPGTPEDRPYQSEVTLDIELAIALAPGAQILVYEAPTDGSVNVYGRIADDDIAQQVSTSWGVFEGSQSQTTLNSENAAFMQMAAQGQSMYAASGDEGDHDLDANNNLQFGVHDPASQIGRASCRERV